MVGHSIPVTSRNATKQRQKLLWGTAACRRRKGANRWLCQLVTGLAALLVCGCAATGQGIESTPQSRQVRGQDDQGLLKYADPTRLFDSAKRAAGYGPNRDIAKSVFDEAETRFVEATKLEGKARTKGFLSAARKYKAAANRWPDSAIEEDAMFMMAESYFFADQYPKASEAYGRLVKKYQNTRHMDLVDKRRFALARYWVQHHESNPDLPVTPNLFADDRPLFDKFGNGVRVLDQIRFDDPTGKLADDATMAAGVAYFKQEKYLQADEMFSDLRRSFPNSQHQFQAHLLGLKCKLELYQGPQYSETPLEEAEVLVKQIQRQFPVEARDHREYLTEAWKRIRMNKALHDWEMAQYYDRRKEYGAARRYYERVRANYSDTSLAQQAAERLQRIAGRDPKPAQSLPWLANLFPTPEREKPIVARNPLEGITR